MEGKVTMVWRGQTGKYFAIVEYWIGVGFQRVEREIDQATFERLNVQVAP